MACLRKLVRAIRTKMEDERASSRAAAVLAGRRLATLRPLPVPLSSPPLSRVCYSTSAARPIAWTPLQPSVHYLPLLPLTLSSVVDGPAHQRHPPRWRRPRVPHAEQNAAVCCVSSLSVPLVSLSLTLGLAFALRSQRHLGELDSLKEKATLR